MEEDKLSFLDQPRDDNGRFASKDNSQPVAEPVQAPESPPASAPPEAPVAQPVQEQAAPAQQPETASKPEPGHIPVAALLDEREKRQKYERELEQLRAQLAEAQKRPEQAIDPITDPEAFDRQIKQQLQQARWDAITSVSQAMALKNHGPEKVQQAEEWLKSELQTNPHFWQTVQRQIDPYDFVVQQHQRTLKFAEIGDDPVSWAQKWAEANGYSKTTQQQPAGSAAPISNTTPLPRPSLAAAPAATGNAIKIPVGNGVAFDEVFKR